MELVIVDDYAALSRAAAVGVTEIIRAKPDAAIVVAVGDTPVGLYRELSRRRQRDEIDTGRLRIFQLDEYWGLAPTDSRLLYRWLEREFILPLHVHPSNVVRLWSKDAEVEMVCAEFDHAISAVGGFDLAILGLGPNGHLGFNEPPSKSNAPTRRVALSEASIASNARYWGGREKVPSEALTCGMRWLLAAKQILLLVSGQHKHDILKRTLDGMVTPNVPSSYLQQVDTAHVIADQAAWA